MGDYCTPSPQAYGNRGLKSPGAWDQVHSRWAMASVLGWGGGRRKVQWKKDLHQLELGILTVVSRQPTLNWICNGYRDRDIYNYYLIENYVFVTIVVNDYSIEREDIMTYEEDIIE